MRTNITETTMELFQSPNFYKNFLRLKYPRTFLFYRLNQSVILSRSDLESIFWALEQHHESFNDIGAHQDFQMPEYFMPCASGHHCTEDMLGW